MLVHHLMLAGAVAGSLAFSAAQAAPGAATGDVNLRTGPGTNYQKITTIPEGAPVEVLGCPSWCEVVYAGRRGWASSNYIASGGGAVLYEAVPPPPRPPLIVAPPPLPPRAYWRHGRPWWDDRYDTWYDGHSYWYDGGWYDRPRSGISFSFGFD